MGFWEENHRTLLAKLGNGDKIGWSPAVVDWAAVLRKVKMP